MSDEILYKKPVLSRDEINAIKRERNRQYWVRAAAAQEAQKKQLTADIADVDFSE